jgi:hypothetical protein
MAKLYLVMADFRDDDVPLHLCKSRRQGKVTPTRPPRNPAKPRGFLFSENTGGMGLHFPKMIV